MTDSIFLNSGNNLHQVACIGGANLDFKAKGDRSLMLRDSNPVRVHATLGGVARNIAENLARLGISVDLYSRVGADPEGDVLLQKLDQLGITISGVTRSQRFPTATYTAVLEPDGEMLIALANMEIYDEMTPDVLSTLSELPASAYWVVDSNLPESTLQYLACNIPPQTKLWGIPVSASKVCRFRSILSQLDGLVLNSNELAILAQQTLSSQEELQKIALDLLDKGLSGVVVTHGKEGVFLATPGQSQFVRLDSRSVHSDVTGGGDAFAAGLLFGLIEGKHMEEAIRFGFASARIALQSLDTVNPLLNRETLFSLVH